MTPLDLLAAATVGALLGVGYFGGLWWTIARLGRWRRPGVALSVGFALRAAFVVAAFVALARFGAPLLLAAFVGFVAVRPALLRSLGPRSAAADAPIAGPRGRG